MNAENAQNAAVLGLGIIGSRACRRLQEAGWNVACWNRTPKNVPGEAATPQRAIQGARVISLYLKDVPAVRAVVSQLAFSLKPGQIVLNHSTVDLDTTQWLKDRCDEAECEFLDAPFTGSKNASGEGQLVYYTGGDPQLVDQLRGYLALTSRQLLHCGGVGSATVVKLATNLISACTVQALAEALGIALSHGVTADCFLKAVAENACGSILSGMKLPTMTEGNFDTHFSLDNMRKDSRYALALADDAGLETPAIAAVSQRMSELCKQGLAGLDYSALAKPYLAQA